MGEFAHATDYIPVHGLRSDDRGYNTLPFWTGLTGMARAPIIVGMSGGVDSSVAALLLKQQGHEVSGLFMKNWDEDDGSEYCTARRDLEDAARVCEKLGIDLHTANFAAEYWENVFEEFLREYAAGRTPNPDILCNREIKFKQFKRYARELGACAIGTGHYARISRSGEGVRLLRGVDRNKDQSYFLQALEPGQLDNVMFPVGELDKPAVRQLAARHGLHNHRRKDSTGICFIGERRFRDFLSAWVPPHPGPIVDETGRVIGEHAGLAYYTLGQRRGLGIGGLAGRDEAPWYVLAKNMESNRLVVTQNHAALENNWLSAVRLNWLADDVRLPLHCTAKIRYRQADQAATVTRRADGAVLVRFATSQRAVTPGQYVCFYDGEVCLGGGIIDAYGTTPC